MSVNRKKIINENSNIGNLAYGSMPDYNRAVLLATWNSESNKDIPIWKVQVPGYVGVFGSCGDLNQDTVIALSNTIAKLQDGNTPTDKQKCVYLDGTASDSTFGGGVGLNPILPGTNTYMTFCGGNIGYHLVYIPCMFVPSSISSTLFCKNTGSKVTTDWSNDLNGVDDKQYLIVPGGSIWKDLFNNNWKANFPSLDLSMYLVHRQSQSSIFSEYEVAA